MNTPPSSPSPTLTLPDPLPLDGGAELAPVTIGYQQYGEMDGDGGNVILIFHALTGDQYVASPHPGTGRPGWWERMVGPGLPIDTDRFCVICANVIGGCMGSTGPASEGPDGAPYGQSFPVVTIHDMVRAIARLLDAKGIEKVHAVVGGSMGGMQALAFASDFPERAGRVLVLASAARQSAQNIAFHEVGRQAIMADANWQGGSYYGGTQPDAGLAVARMAAHITYLSEAGLTEKFGRRLQDRPDGSEGTKSFGFDADFQIESYLRYQGSGFTRRFDANSYLYITRAMDYFDLAEKHGGRLADAFAQTTARFCIVSFDTDWLYPTAESQHLVRALNAAGAPVSFVELSTPFGHDGFLLETPGLDEVVRGFVS
tara:strand:+ start:2502 stop:3617 length:1116 start_codon:yes stop_codon:yes gene_type:complete